MNGRDESLADDDPKGIIPRAIGTLFKEMRAITAASGSFLTYRVTVSHLEIYNEELTDLLGTGLYVAEQGMPPPRTSSRALARAARRKGVSMEYVPKGGPSGGAASKWDEGGYSDSGSDDDVDEARRRPWDTSHIGYEVLEEWARKCKTDLWNRGGGDKGACERLSEISL